MTGAGPIDGPLAKGHKMTDATIDVTDLKQWTYCPRIVYYRYCLPRIRPTTHLMNAGIEAHRDEAAREERRGLRLYDLETGERVVDLSLIDHELGLRGRLDLAIAVPDRASAGATAVVVDYKYTEQQAGAHFKLQLAAYAILLERAWQLPVPTGYLYQIPLRRANAVPITPPLRQKAMTTIETIHRSIRRETMPPPPASRYPCVSCEFRRFCNDVI